MTFTSPSKAIVGIGRAVAAGIRAGAVGDAAVPTTSTDWFAATRTRNDADPRRHTLTFRWYETDRRDFRYLVEDIWDGYPVDEGATDSMVEVLRLVLAAAEQGYASRILDRQGSSMELNRPGEGGFLDEEWYPPRAESLLLVGR